MDLSPFIWSQILVIIAIVFDILSFQFKARRKILFFAMISTGLLATHYYLLGSLVAALIAGVATTRYAISIFNNHRYWLYFYIALSAVFLVIMYDNITNFLPFWGSVFASIAVFQSDDKYIRQYFMIASSFWIANDIVVWSPMAILNQSFFLGSNLVGYWRYYIRKDEKPPSPGLSDQVGQ